MGIGPDISRVRALYTNAPTDESACDELLKMTAPFGSNKDMLIVGYLGAATMIKAKYLFNPVRKLIWFRRGQALLEKAVTADGSAPELRFLRYSIQIKSPRLLGYYSDVETDRQILVRFLNGRRSDELGAMVRKFLDSQSR